MHKFAWYYRAAMCSDTCELSLWRILFLPLPAAPALASLHAYAPRSSSWACKKNARLASENIFCGGCRAFIRRLLVNFWRTGADKAAANLVSRCPVRIRSFPHVWSGRSSGKRMQLRARWELLSFPAFVEDRHAGTSEMSTYFYRARTTRCTMLRIDLWNYGDAWNVTQPYRYLSMLSTFAWKSTFKISK